MDSNRAGWLPIVANPDVPIVEIARRYAREGYVLKWHDGKLWLVERRARS